LTFFDEIGSGSGLGRAAPRLTGLSALLELADHARRAKARNWATGEFAHIITPDNHIIASLASQFHSVYEPASKRWAFCIRSPSVSPAADDQIEPGGQLGIGAASGNDGSASPKIMQIETMQIRKPTVMITASCRISRRLACVDRRARFTPSPNVSRCALFRRP
jgi:hypothetical protein